MKKDDFKKVLAEKLNVTQKEAVVILDSFTEVIFESLEKGESVPLNEVGKIEVVERAARTARNPQTGDPIEVAAKKAPKFKPSKALKDAVKG